MNQTDINILNLENKILKNRGELNDLIFQLRQEKNADVLMNQKLIEMEREIEYLGKQLVFLKESWVESGVVQSTVAGEQTQKEEDAVAHEVISESVLTVSKVLQKEAEKTPMPQQARIQQERPAKQQKDMESMIGKSWMGAIASVLIFCSIIMFATLILPTLTDTVKMVVMYGVSILVTVLGLVRLHKDEKSPFNLALSACGIGAIYISLILTNMYFKAIGDIALYLLITVWVIFVCVISKLKSMLFQIIGQIGILFAIFFGCKLCCEYDDAVKFVVLVFFYLITSLIFMWVHYSKELSGNLISLIFNHVNAWIILFASNQFELDSKMYIVSGVMMAYVISSLAICFKVNINKAIVGSLLTISNLFIIAQFLLRCLENEFALGVIQLMVAIVLIGLVEWKFKDKGTEDKRILQCYAMIMLFFAVVGMHIWAETLLLVIISAGLLVYGYDRKDFMYHFGSVILMAVIVLDMEITVMHCAVSMVYFALLLVLILWKRDQYNGVLKLCGYAVFAFMMWRFRDLIEFLPLENDAIEALHLSLLILTHVIVMKTIGVKSLVTGKNEGASEAVFGVYNIRLMMMSMACIISIEHTVWHLVSILVSGVIFMINSGNLLKRYQGKEGEMFAGIYIGIKLTVLLWLSLASFDTANIIVSIACFVLAIVGIMIGFGKQFKSLRIYGLVLALFSVFKLIMIDIDYNHLTGRAAGFFICGVLCFVISLIYNTIDKKIKKN